MSKRTEFAIIASSGVRERDEEVVRHATSGSGDPIALVTESIYFLEHLGTLQPF
jgi:hypothetical protein